MVAETISVRMLGRFEVSVGGRVLPQDRWRRRRAADLVKLLGLAPAQRLSREQVMDALWPDLPPDRAAANLRKAAHHARNALGVADAVVLDGANVSLCPTGPAIIDVAEFREAAAQALESEDVDASRQIASTYGGELLPDDRYAEWAMEARDELHRLYCRLLAGGGLWGRLVEVDPIDERAHQQILRAHLEHGDRASALRQYETMRQVLADQLGVAPDPASAALYEQALALDTPDVPTPAERARALLAWGVVHWERHDLEEAQATATAARALAVDAGLGRELADASELLGLVAHAQGRWQEMFFEQFRTTIRTHPDFSPFLLDAHMCMSEFALNEEDGPAQFAELAGRVLSDADEVDSDQGRALGLLLRGEARLFDPRTVSEAMVDLTDAARLHEAGGSLTGTVLAMERLAQAVAINGRPDVARKVHHEALELARSSAIPKHLVPFVWGGLLGAVPDDEQRQLLDEAVSVLDDGEACDPCSMALRIGAVEVCARAGGFVDARRHLADAERIADMWEAGPWKAAVVEARAVLVAEEGGDLRTVRQLLEQAADGYAAALRPLEADRCRRRESAIRGTLGERAGS